MADDQLKNIFADGQSQQPQQGTRALSVSTNDSLTSLLDQMAEENVNLGNTVLETSASEATLLNDLMRAQDEASSEYAEISENMEDIARLPGKISKFIGIFDSDYNIGVQQVRSERVARRYEVAKTRVSMGQQLLTQKLKNAQTRAGIVKDTIGTKLDIQRINMEGARLRLAQKESERKNMQMAISGMTPEQLQNEIKRSSEGKGPFAGLTGLLQDELVRDQQASIALESAAFELNQGRKAAAKKHTVEAISNYTVDQLNVLLEQAQATDGKFLPFDVNGKIVQLTVNDISQAISMSSERDHNTAQIMAQNDIQKSNIPGRLEEVETASARLAQAGVRFESEFANTVNIEELSRGGGAVSVADEALKADQAKIEQLAEQVRKSMDNKQAGEAAENYIRTGSFGSSAGASAVVAEAFKAPASLKTDNYFGNAMHLVALEAASKLGADNGAINEDGSIEIMDLFSKSLKQKGANTIYQETMSDPAIARRAAQSIDAKTQTDLIASTIAELAQDIDGAPPPAVWQEFSQAFQEGKFIEGGQLRVSAMFDFLNRRSIQKNGAIIRHSKTFLQELERVAGNREEALTNENILSMTDAAFITSLYGRSGISAVLDRAVTSMRRMEKDRAAAHEEALQDDLTGGTDNEALRGAILTGGAGLSEDMLNLVREGIKPKSSETLTTKELRDRFKQD